MFNSCSTKNINYKVSKAISKNHNYKEIIPDKNFKLSRKAIIDSGKLSFVNFNSDTLYVLEMVDLESVRIMAKIFNNDKALTYSFSNKEISFNDHQYFSGKIETLVKSGDTLELIKQGNLYDTIHPRPMVYASRIIFVNGDYKISTYTFLL